MKIKCLLIDLSFKLKGSFNSTDYIASISLVWDLSKDVKHPLLLQKHERGHLFLSLVQYDHKCIQSEPAPAECFLWDWWLNVLILTACTWGLSQPEISHKRRSASKRIQSDRYFKLKNNLGANYVNLILAAMHDSLVNGRVEVVHKIGQQDLQTSTLGVWSMGAHGKPNIPARNINMRFSALLQFGCCNRHDEQLSEWYELQALLRGERGCLLRLSVVTLNNCFKFSNENLCKYLYTCFHFQIFW
jgi:hypothetical protein